MSKFLKRLERIWAGKSQPMGFGAQAKAKYPAMALVAMLPQGKVEVTTLNTAGVDAVLVSIEEIEPLSQLIREVGDIPLGIWAKGASQVDVRRLIELGCDFMIFSANEMPAAPLMEKGIGRVLESNLSLSDSLARSISRLPIDAVLLKSEEQPLTVRQLMDYQRITSLIGKPSFSTLPPEIEAGDIQGLWQAGVRGVVLSLGHPQLTQVKQAIRTLPLTREGEKMDVFLPFVAEASGEELEEEEI